MLAFDLLAAHMVGDYILQNDWVARHKLTDRGVRIAHCVFYAAPFALVSVLHSESPVRRIIFFGLVIATHFIVDSYQWGSGDKWPPKPLLVDQTLHLVTLAILGRILL